MTCVPSTATSRSARSVAALISRRSGQSMKSSATPRSARVHLSRSFSARTLSMTKCTARIWVGRSDRA